MQKRLLIGIGMAFLVVGSAAALTKHGTDQRQIPIIVTGEVKPDAIEQGHPIPLTVSIHNGYEGDIGHGTYGLKPTDWNGETLNVRLVNIYRDGEQKNRFLARPEIDPPRRIAGIALKTIAPGETLRIETDAHKWKIRGGWKPGRYRVDVRIDNLRVDPYSTASVMSDPFEFVIEKRP